MTDHHHHTLLKLLSRARSTLLPAPISSWHWLLSNFPTFEPPVLSIIHDNRILIPVHLLSTLLTRFDILNTHRPSSNITTQFSSPSTRTWQKCRFAAPKVAQHHGAIRSSSGELCTTTKTLDQALRATRSFWSQPPSPYHPDWTVLLKDYALTSAHFPSCNAPNYDDFYHSVITSPDLVLELTAFLILLGVSAPQCLQLALQDILIILSPLRRHLPFSLWFSFQRRMQGNTRTITVL